MFLFCYSCPKRKSRSQMQDKNKTSHLPCYYTFSLTGHQTSDKQWVLDPVLLDWWLLLSSMALLRNQPSSSAFKALGSAWLFIHLSALPMAAFSLCWALFFCSSILCPAAQYHFPHSHLRCLLSCLHPPPSCYEFMLTPPLQLAGYVPGFPWPPPNTISF